MRSEVRWSVLVLVLAVAGVVALWPRDADPAAMPTTGATPQVLDGPVPRTAPAPNDAALAPLRQRAALQPCPSPMPDGPPASGPLAGITVPCLGAPGRVDLAAALAGRPALLNLWASWCPPCREEMPVLAAYASSSDAIPVIGVNVQDRPADALSLLTALGITYPSVTDPAAALQGALAAPRVLPLSYILRPDGSIQQVNPPRVFETPDEVHHTVRQYLGQQG